MRAINGEELMDRVDFILSRVKTPEMVRVFQTLKSYLENAPTLTLDDLRPKGRWVHKRSIYDPNIYICSNCKEQISILGNKLPSCPYCIADMRARTEE